MIGMVQAKIVSLWNESVISMFKLLPTVLVFLKDVDKEKTRLNNSQITYKKVRSMV